MVVLAAIVRITRASALKRRGAARATQEVARRASDVITTLTPSSVCAVMTCVTVGLLAATLVSRTLLQKRIATTGVAKRSHSVSCAVGRARDMTAWSAAMS